MCWLPWLPLGCFFSFSACVVLSCSLSRSPPSVRSRLFYDKRIAMEVAADQLGDEYAGYVFRIMGGNDKQGFPMKQGVMIDHRIKLLLSKGQ
eukprot:SAG22_NODE_7527_length_731_cov_1.303797_1_plen_91_part_10